MIGTLVDSNVILDILTEDPVWFARSSDAVERCANTGPLFINVVIYAEVSVGFQRIEDLEEALPASDFPRLHIPLEAGFLAAKAYQAYSQRGGAKTSPLPDFLIGAHAAVAGLQLLTRDAGRYRTYFPNVHIIAPSG
ncbi:type II toxin-antitoxin system VapC family toxin [Candidatus Fermentibacteria bacterium]|nr:type II toxin-antitoxin system VapC family toxin [Candidatus Fermentibacteria bacterium]